MATFSCFRFTPGLAFGEKDIGHLAITEYLSLTGQGNLRNRKIISERKQTFYANSLPVQWTDKESIFFVHNIFLSANPTKPTLLRNSESDIWCTASLILLTLKCLKIVNDRPRLHTMQLSSMQLSFYPSCDEVELGLQCIIWAAQSFPHNILRMKCLI